MLRLLPAYVLIAVLAAGCFAVRPITGADADLEQLARAREAAMMKVRCDAARALSHELDGPSVIDAADVSVSLTEAALNKAAVQLDSASGWLDPVTSYRIIHTSIAVHNGSCIASISLQAHNNEHNIDVDLLLDCLVTLHMERSVLTAHCEPFNIAPEVTAHGLKKLASGIIRDLITIRMSAIATELPPIEIPIEFHNHFTLPGRDIRVRSGLNMNVHLGERSLSYDMRISGVRFYEKTIVIAFALSKIGVM